MNQELWTSLNDKVAQRDQLQTQLDELRGEIQQLATNLQQQLDEYRQTGGASTTETEPVPEA